MNAGRGAGNAPAVTRAATGVAGLDDVLDGGFPANRAILLCGGPGTGKSLFGLQFLSQGLADGEPGVFVCVDEKPAHLIEEAASFGWDLERDASASTLAILDASPYFTSTSSKGWARSGFDARQVASDLVQQVRSIKARRLVIDTMTSLVPHDMDRGHAEYYLRSLIQSLEDNLGCTILLTCRAERDDPQGSCAAARYLASGLLELRLRERGQTVERTLAVRKMRRTAVEPVQYAVTIDRHSGLALASASTDARACFSRRPVAQPHPEGSVGLASLTAGDPTPAI
jgi:circadian clock protein KaiC